MFAVATVSGSNVVDAEPLPRLAAASSGSTAVDFQSHVDRIQGFPAVIDDARRLR